MRIDFSPASFFFFFRIICKPELSISEGSFFVFYQRERARVCVFHFDKCPELEGIVWLVLIPDYVIYSGARLCPLCVRRIIMTEDVRTCHVVHIYLASRLAGVCLAILFDLIVTYLLPPLPAAPEFRM